MGLRERIGIDLGRRVKLEDGIEWAAKNDVRYVDIQLDTAANAVTAFDDQRAEDVRQLAAKHGVTLGLHTLSAVNVAE
ncbi:MAG TPA: sugar phosphate isomerase/epimerase, partial [Burkholderiales bacterium]|nr:sugar phosphate isomerase/epimerase [Burkholderiales bacterium]